MTTLMNSLGTADIFKGISDACQMYANEIHDSGTAHPLTWHVYRQLTSIADKAFDISGCIRIYNQPETDKETSDMNNTPSIHDVAPEMCDALSEIIADLDDALANDPLNVHLTNTRHQLREAINRIDCAEAQMAKYAQSREDHVAVAAIRDAINNTFSHEGNAGPANGMLQDIAAFGPQILEAIRSAGYQVTPLG